MAESWEVCRHHVARITAGFERIIRDGVARGEFEADDPAEAAACIHTAIARYSHPLLVGQYPRPSPATARGGHDGVPAAKPRADAA